MKIYRLLTPIILLSAAIIYSFCFPKAKYTSPDILSQLEIPYKIQNWQGEDAAEEINPEDERYYFVSEVFAREYSCLDRNSQFTGKSAYGYDAFLVILDAGNFHHPRICFKGAGFVMKELNDTELHILGRTIKAPTLYAQKGSESLLVLYWICIDKELVNWTEQKIKQLWFSMFNRKKTGLMIRVDIPVEKGDIESSLATAKEFFKEISQNIPPEQIDYIFGKST